MLGIISVSNLSHETALAMSSGRSQQYYPLISTELQPFSDRYLRTTRGSNTYDRCRNLHTIILAPEVIL